MEPMKPLQPMAPMDFWPAWWPDDLGEPSSSGGQDGMRYAFFDEAHRLLIEEGGELATYDTGQHRISGVSQAQSSGRTLAFTSQEGPVRLDTLKRID